MEELEEKIVKFAQDRDWLKFNTPENLAKSISIESGELLECFQWNNNYDKDELKYEIADVMNYCILLCHQIGVNPKQIILDKMKISEKKYPIEKFKGISRKYNKLVRDKIPEIIKKENRRPITRLLKNEEYINELNKKLQEEVKEYLEDNNVEELADIVEVIYGILDSENVTIEEFETIRKSKAEKRGAFKERIFLEKVLEDGE